MLCSRFSAPLALSAARPAASRLALAASSSSSSIMWMPRRWAAAASSDDAKDGADKKDQQETPVDQAVHEEIARLQGELKKMTEKAEEFKRAAQYSAAEAENARRIAREDVAKANSFGIQKFAKDVLEVNDTLERAIDSFEKLQPEEQKMLNEHKVLSGLVTGVKLSHSVMIHNMARHGVEPIKANVGDTFDPHVHDAVFQAPATDEVKEGQICNILKKGFMLKDRVLRATQVGVAQNLTK